MNVALFHMFMTFMTFMTFTTFTTFIRQVTQVAAMKLSRLEVPLPNAVQLSHLFSKNKISLPPRRSVNPQKAVVRYVLPHLERHVNKVFLFFIRFKMFEIEDGEIMMRVLTRIS